MGIGVRKLSLEDQSPSCDIIINNNIYDLKDLVKDKSVVDIGCGFGANRLIVESNGGTWLGVEPFEAGDKIIKADAQSLPFKDNEFDIVIMDAVLEHIPDVGKAFSEASRVLKSGGIFIGYVAFMECFHEISYSHLSFKAMEYYSEINKMKLEKISGGSAFGIDYHLSVLFYPIPFKFMRKVIALLIRLIFKLKSKIALIGLITIRKLNLKDAKQLSDLYYKLECLRQSNGFSYIIRKL